MLKMFSVKHFIVKQAEHLPDVPSLKAFFEKSSLEKLVFQSYGKKFNLMETIFNWALKGFWKPTKGLKVSSPNIILTWECNFRWKQLKGPTSLSKTLKVPSFFF